MIRSRIEYASHRLCLSIPFLTKEKSCLLLYLSRHFSKFQPPVLRSSNCEEAMSIVINQRVEQAIEQMKILYSLKRMLEQTDVLIIMEI